MSITIHQVPDLLNSLQKKVNAKDPQAAQLMNSHRVSPKELQCKRLHAKSTNWILSSTLRTGGNTRERLKAKLKARSQG